MRFSQKEKKTTWFWIVPTQMSFYFTGEFAGKSSKATFCTPSSTFMSLLTYFLFIKESFQFKFILEKTKHICVEKYFSRILLHRYSFWQLMCMYYPRLASTERTKLQNACKPCHNYWPFMASQHTSLHFESISKWNELVIRMLSVCICR